MPSRRCLRACLRSAVAALAVAAVPASPAAAHPVPFSYLDVRISNGAIDGALIVHVIDVAHELGVEPAERLLDPAVARSRSDEIAALIARRLTITAGGRAIPADWVLAEVLPDRQAIRLRARMLLASPAGRLVIDARLFPYDPNHKTFVNVYAREALSQAILDDERTRYEYFAGTAQGRLAAVGAFLASGVHHILIGPDHILFLCGLLLLGGSLRRLAFVVTGFTVGHSVTLSLAALDVLNPPGSFVEPVIALSIVYVGLDNLMANGGRDLRVWIALGFGLIHGFGFASVLRDVGLPPGALGWSLFSFNLGVEIGQLLVVAAVATTLAAVRARSETLGRRLAFAGSLVMVAAGSFWFLERIGVMGGL